jgi:hypothetical protein
MFLQVSTIEVFTGSQNPGKVQSCGGHTDPLTTLDNPAKSRTVELKCHMILVIGAETNIIIIILISLQIKPPQELCTV